MISLMHVKLDCGKFFIILSMVDTFLSNILVVIPVYWILDTMPVANIPCFMIFIAFRVEGQVIVSPSICIFRDIMETRQRHFVVGKSVMQLKILSR